MAVCRSCGTANADAAKFCNECAAPLTAPTAPVEQRKTVTVLFADVTGSTQLGEQLDPESLRHVLARYFETASAAVVRHGGTVEKFIGDAVMAVFGIPKVHEDDALRAVRAAVDLRSDVDRLNEQLRHDFGTSLQIRVGVNTGEVVTGTAERLATGDTVNVAARLEQLAEPGEVLVGEPTWQLLGHAADVKELSPATLKGKSAPLRVFRVLSVAPSSARVLDTPMVGRSEQLLLLLQNAFAVARRDGACSLFTLLGSAGVGKSRLVAEFVRGVDATVVGGRCLSYGEGITYWPLVEILAQLRSSAVAGAVEEAVGEDNAVRAAVAAVMEEGHGVTSSADIAWAARRLFERAAEQQPLVVVVDDLHWAEPTLLDLVEHVVDLSRGFPILLLAMARPELLELRRGWGGGKLNSTTVLLEPLDPAETDELVAALAPQLSEGLREQVRVASGGNPLFAEAMVPLVAAAPEGARVTVPPTIQALVAARLDQLDEAERRVLQCGAVEGQAFHRGSVAALLPDEPLLGDRLVALVRKDLIRPDRPLVPGDEAFRFRHLAIRDAAYDALSKAARAQLHRGFATWLEQTTRLPDHDEITGYHLEQSYRCREQLGPVDEDARHVAAQAAARLEAAGRRSLLRGDMAAALGLLDRAQRLAPGDGRDLSLELARDHALTSCGRLEEAARRMREVADAAAARGDEVGSLRARLAYLNTMVSKDPGRRVPELRELVDRARPVLEASGDPAALTSLWRGLGALAQLSCRFGDALSACLEVMRYAELAHDQLLLARTRGFAAGMVAWSPLPIADGLPLVEQWQNELDRPSLDIGDVTALLLGISGRTEQARELHEQMRQAMVERGLVLAAGFSGQNGWFIEMAAGDVAAAERTVRDSYALLEEAGERSFLSTQACYLAECAYRFGRYDEAEHWARHGRELGDEDDVITHVWAGLIEAKTLARRGQHRAAQDLAGRSLVAAQEMQAPIGRGLLLVMHAEVLHLEGKAQPSAEALVRGLDLLERKGASALAAQARRDAAGWSGP